MHKFSRSHRLDVAHAHAALCQYPEAIAVLQELRRARPQRLPQQRYAADILRMAILHRRRLTDEMRELAGFLRLPLCRCGTRRRPIGMPHPERVA